MRIGAAMEGPEEKKYLAPEKVYRTAMYLRLSVDDGTNQESESITNQRMIIQSFVLSHPEFCIVDEYVDDGYSGTNFDRPEFRRMYLDLECGAVNCILVKDLSRFGRNYIDVGMYLEQRLPEMGVRLVAINDHYDSLEMEEGNSIIVPMRNLMNDAYCRDISLKVRSQLYAKQSQGLFVGCTPPFGYKKDLLDHNHLVIDEKEAVIVQRIFHDYLSGMSCGSIAEMLDREEVPTPSGFHSEEHANWKDKTHGEKGKWYERSVWRILTNEIYIGNLVQGKRSKLSPMLKKTIWRPKEEWIRTEHKVDPIISEEIYLLAGTMLSSGMRLSPGHGSTYPLYGLLYCGDCGSRLIRMSKTRKRGNTHYFICGSYKKDRSCSMHFINEKKLMKYVTDTVLMEAGLILRAHKILMERENDPSSKLQKWKDQETLDALKDKIQRSVERKKDLYEAFAEGRIEEAKFREEADAIDKNIKDWKTSMEDIQVHIGKAYQEPAFLRNFRRCEKEELLDRETLLLLVEKIKIYEDKRIEVVFRFRDEIDAILHEAGIGGENLGKNEQEGKVD